MDTDVSETRWCIICVHNWFMLGHCSANRCRFPFFDHIPRAICSGINISLYGYTLLTQERDYTKKRYYNLLWMSSLHLTPWQQSMTLLHSLPYTNLYRHIQDRHIILIENRCWTMYWLHSCANSTLNERQNHVLHISWSPRGLALESRSMTRTPFIARRYCLNLVCQSQSMALNSIKNETQQKAAGNPGCRVIFLFHADTTAYLESPRHDSRSGSVSLQHKRRNFLPVFMSNADQAMTAR